MSLGELIRSGPQILASQLGDDLVLIRNNGGSDIRNLN
jgi:hypothetical protein